MKARELQRRHRLVARDAKYRETGDWYHHLKEFPGVLFDRYGYVVFEDQSQYDHCPELRHTKDLHVVPNIAAIAGYKLYADAFLQAAALDPRTSLRVLQSLSRIRRDRGIVVALKRLYDFTCQRCSSRLLLTEDAPYVEVHHIRPLGEPHRGTDEQQNMMCVCPNCHILLDHFAVPIMVAQLHRLVHDVDFANIEYHNALVTQLRALPKESTRDTALTSVKLGDVIRSAELEI